MRRSIFSYREIFFHFLHAMQSSTHHNEILFSAHLLATYFFFFAVLSNINGGAPSDPCHFLKVTKTCEQPQVLAIVLPNSSINESKNKCMHAPGINLSMASSTSTLMPTPSAFLLQFSNLNFLGHQCLNPKLQHKEAHIANLSGKDEIK